MSSLYFQLNGFLNNGKNLNKIYFFLVVFLCIVKLPSLVSSDIQPWDEGMYAARVLSIHLNGDFIEQSQHSVGGFYSASHPPLLIWIGYFFTLIFGVNSVTLKLIIFVFSLLCVLLILMIGKNLFSLKTGFYAALIFCSNIIFTVFSQRFQFDIPYTFFILFSFYLMFRYNETLKRKYLLLAGISLGFCLMTKILVGFFIPGILFIFYLFAKNKINIKLKDIYVLTATGILIALPWHIYMLAIYGAEFTDYFFKFHIYDRALHGVEMNEKNSGVFYHINYLLSIIPYSVLIFFSGLHDIKIYKSLDWKKIFLWVWFITGLLILTLFKTKLEVYVLIILIPGCFLIPLFIKDLTTENNFTGVWIIFFFVLNILWFATESVRPFIKEYATQSNKLILLSYAIGTIILLFYLSKYIANKIELNKMFYIFILIFFFVINIYYLFFVPEWVNKFKLSGIKEYVDNSRIKKIVYVGTNYRYNPQFSFYFNGLNLDWKNPVYDFEIIDTKDGFDFIKNKLNNIPENKLIIIEKDYINRAEYPSSDLFLPGGENLIIKEKGYELYRK